jgi:hypothetical protein
LGSDHHADTSTPRLSNAVGVHIRCPQYARVIQANSYFMIRLLHARDPFGNEISTAVHRFSSG